MRCFSHAHQAPAHRSGLAGPTAPADRSGLAGPTAPADRSGLAAPTWHTPPRSCTLAATTTMSPLSSRTRITRHRIESGDPPVLTRSDSPTTQGPHGPHPPYWGARYSREDARGLAPLWPPLTLRVQLWVVLLVNLLIIWNGLLVN